MNRLRRPVVSRSLTVLLSVLASYGFIPQRAYGDVVSCSNGVEIQQYNVGSDVVVDLAQGNEVMTVALEAGGTPMYDRVTIDDQLVFEFWWRHNSQGEKVLDYSTFSFQSWTATRDGSQLIAHPQAEQVDGQSQQEELHPAAAAQINLVSYAMSQLHSSAFMNAVTNTQSELQSNGIVACILHIVAWVVSVFALVVGCATVAPCVFALMGHVAAGVAVACNCSPAEC